MYQGEVKLIENSSVSKLKGDCDMLLYCDVAIIVEIDRWRRRKKCAVADNHQILVIGFGECTK